MPSSWFSLSLPNPFTPDHHQSPPNSPTAAAATTTDFSGLTLTLGRQLHSVASFLAPPPSSPSPSPSPPPSSSSPPADDSVDGELSHTSSYLGMKNDLAEIGGSFKTSLSLLSSNKAVSEISRFASNFLFDQGDDLEESEAEAVGVTDEVVDFVREISYRPECWIDFPLSLQYKDFIMTDNQKEHATTIEQSVPSVTALRHNIKSYLSEEQFWMIYFILLLPRLNQDDYRLLSTPEIVQLREDLLQKLRNKNTPVYDRNSAEEAIQDNNTEQINNTSQEIKSPDVDSNATRTKTQDKMDDVSFSDLDDDDKDHSGRPSRTRQAQSGNVSSSSETGDWVRLGQAGQSNYRGRHSEGEESSEWLSINDVDSDT